MISPAIDRLGPRGNRPMADYLSALERASVVHSLANLRTFPA